MPLSVLPKIIINLKTRLYNDNIFGFSKTAASTSKPSSSLPKMIIDLNAILHNYNLIKEVVTPSNVGCVLKANAYGLGVNEVSKMLFNYGNCKIFFVATLIEGLELRKILGSEPTIYILHGLLKEEEKYFVEHNLVPVLSSEHQINIWNNFAIQLGKKLECILHFDTGLNRLGIESHKASKILDQTNNLNIDYIMSHLACSEDHANKMNHEQYSRFIEISKNFPNHKKSFSNSAGTFLGKDFYCDLVRLGKALYGPDKALNLDNKKLQKVLTIKAPILQIKEINEDGTIGYGATRKVTKGMKIAILGIGYADGYLRYLGNKATSYINGYHADVIGKVSMDLITIDITKVPNDRINVGDYVELLGNNVCNDDILIQAGTSSYELFTRLGQRFVREYIQINQPVKVY